MNIVILYNHDDKLKVKKKFKRLEKEFSRKITFFYIRDNCSVEHLKVKRKMSSAEILFLFNANNFHKKNSEDLLNLAKLNNINNYYIKETTEKDYISKKLKEQLNFEGEFDELFSENTEDYLELYRILVNSSENLINRRQRVNLFFITVISVFGSMIGLFGTYLNNLIVPLLFMLFGLILCYLWKQHINNFSNLNSAKFDVIWKLENKLGAQPFRAEWIALGKYRRKHKYSSMTKLEQKLPIVFGTLIGLLSLKQFFGLITALF